MAKRTRNSKKMTWLKFPHPGHACCIHGGVSVLIKPWTTRGEWEVYTLGGCFIVTARTMAAAKRKAIIQARERILEAAEAWRDS